MPSIEELRARYSRTETEADTIGRQITVGLLKPDQRYRVLELSDSQSPYVLVPFTNAATVRKIIDVDGKEMLFAAPRDRTDIDIILNVLDDEGMLAVSRALSRLNPRNVDGNAKNPVIEAGNSQGTASSGSIASS